MRQVAREAFATDASLDAVQVHEHAGWYLTFLRDGTVVGTANDQATSMTKPLSSSTASTATTRWERFVVPDTTGRSRRFHLCEFTPSYECPFVGSAIGNTDLEETDAERLDDTERRSRNGAVEYVRQRVL